MVIVSAGISGSVSKLDTLPPSHSSAMAGSLRFCIHMAGSPAEASTKLKRRLVEAVGFDSQRSNQTSTVARLRPTAFAI